MEIAITVTVGLSKLYLTFNSKFHAIIASRLFRSTATRGRTDNCVKIDEKPRVTHGMVLRETYLELLMGSFYVSTATTYSWYGFT